MAACRQFCLEVGQPHFQSQIKKKKKLIKSYLCMQENKDELEPIQTSGGRSYSFFVCFVLFQEKGKI